MSMKLADRPYKGCHKEATEHEKEYALEYQAAALSKSRYYVSPDHWISVHRKKIIYSLLLDRIDAWAVEISRFLNILRITSYFFMVPR